MLSIYLSTINFRLLYCPYNYMYYRKEGIGLYLGSYFIWQFFFNFVNFLYYLLMHLGLIEHSAIWFSLPFLPSISPFFSLYFLFTLCFPFFCSFTSYSFKKNVLVFDGYYSIMPVLSRNHRIHSNRAQIQSKNLLHCFSKISYQLFRFWKETKSCFSFTDKRSEPIMFF